MHIQSYSENGMTGFRGVQRFFFVGYSAQSTEMGGGEGYRTELIFFFKVRSKELKFVNILQVCN